MSGDPANPLRYYPNPHEQRILIQGLHNYFALPERSPSRNKIAKDVSTFLRMYSPHWTHRAVRLWFNNNRHTYLNLVQPIQVFQDPSYQLPPTFRPNYPVVAPPPPPIAFCSVAPPPPPPPVALRRPPKSKLKVPRNLDHPNPPPRDPKPEQVYAPVSTMIKVLKQAYEASASQILEFDNACHQLLSKYGAVKAERIEPSLTYVNFPPPGEPSTDGPFVPSAFPMCGEVEPRGEFWQNRAYQETTIHGFDCGFIGVEFAGFVTHNSLTIWPHRRPSTEVTIMPFNPIGPIESICVSGQATFLLSKAGVLIVPFNRFELPTSLVLAVSGAGTMAPFDDGVAIGFPGTPEIVKVSGRGDQRSIPIPFRGVKCLIGIGSHLVCGVTQSCVIRRLTGSGHETGIFVGHCGAVMALENMSESRFVSYGKDDTARVWNVEDRSLVMTVVLGHVSLVALAGSNDFVVCGLQSRRIAVADMRKAAPALGVQTQEFLPNKMLYCPVSDVLLVFAVQEADPSDIFGDADRRGARKAVFRKYQRFTVERRAFGL